MSKAELLYTENKQENEFSWFVFDLFIIRPIYLAEVVRPSVFLICNGSKLTEQCFQKKTQSSELVSDLLQAATTLLLDPFISIRHLWAAVSLQHLKQAIALGPLTFPLIAPLSQLINVSFDCTFFSE